jgi:hypothetical protein
MIARRGARVLPYPRSRQLLSDFLAIAGRRHTVHALVEVDVTVSRQLLREHRAHAGEPLSFTAPASPGRWTRTARCRAFFCGLPGQLGARPVHRQIRPWQAGVCIREASLNGIGQMPGRDRLVHHAAKPGCSCLRRRVERLCRHGERGNAGTAGIGTDDLQRLGPAEVRHHQVHEDEPWAFTFCFFYSFPPSTRGDGTKAEVIEDRREDRPVVGVVVHDQNHGTSPVADLAAHCRTRHAAEA